MKRDKERSTGREKNCNNKQRQENNAIDEQNRKVILSRDVPGQRSLSRDIYSCPCPGTKGHRDKENVLVPGQRDSGTSRENATLNQIQGSLVKCYKLGNMLKVIKKLNLLELIQILLNDGAKRNRFPYTKIMTTPIDRLV